MLYNGSILRLKCTIEQAGRRQVEPKPGRDLVAQLQAWNGRKGSPALLDPRSIADGGLDLFHEGIIAGEKYPAIDLHDLRKAPRQTETCIEEPTDVA